MQVANKVLSRPKSSMVTCDKHRTLLRCGGIRSAMRYLSHAKPLTALCGLALSVMGCSVGGQYGYSVGSASVSRSSMSRDAAEFQSSTRSLLQSELLRQCDYGQPDIQGYGNGYAVEYKVRGVRGCIIRHGRLWELIQVTFIQPGDGQGQVSVIVDGWTAPGFEYPLDSQFTRSMEPEYAGALMDFARQLASGFGSYQGK
jgi:hypothetical protein